MLRALSFLCALLWLCALASPASARIAVEPIREVIRAAAPEVRRCIEACRSCHPSEYRITVSFTVAPSGAVTEAVVGDRDLAEPQLAACLVDVVLGLRFPARDGTRAGDVRINYPFLLVVPEPQSPPV